MQFDTTPQEPPVTITHSTLSPAAGPPVPLHCTFCGQTFVGPASLVGTGCPNNRLVAASDVFQANPEDLDVEVF